MLTRSERISLVAFLVLLVVMSFWLVHEWRWENENLFKENVPGAVLYDNQGDKAVKSEQVMRWGYAEADHIAKTWTIPPYVMVSATPFGWNGITVVESKPTRYTIVLVQYTRPYEPQVRFTMAHELGHVLLAEHGITQDEHLADTFARCYGSPLAQEYAKSNDRGDSCDELAKLYEKGTH